VETIPGTVNPTAAWDATLTDASGADLMGGALANRSASAAEIAHPATVAKAIDSTLTLTITGTTLTVPISW